MPKWEDIFLKEMKRFVFGISDPNKLTKYLIMTLGVPSRTIECKLDKLKKVGPAKTGEFNGIPVSICARKSGTIQLEEFLRLVPRDTVEYVIGLGAVGALQPEIKIGDLIIPTNAIRGDGLTGYYYPPNIPAKPDPELTDVLYQSAVQAKASVHTGTIFTTGSLLHETDELIQDWHTKGYLGVDCEASAFFLLCQYCGFKCTLILYVTDNPYTKQVFSNNFQSILRVFRAKRKAVKAVFNTISVISEV
jgi:uridine phosphorylase